MHDVGQSIDFQRPVVFQFFCMNQSQSQSPSQHVGSVAVYYFIATVVCVLVAQLILSFEQPFILLPQRVSSFG